MKTCERATVGVRGAVQGVGFRPFVYRLATELELRGWVLNSGQGVSIEVEGECGAVRSFVRRLESEKPAHARIQGLESAFSDTVGYPDFEIRHSEDDSEKTAFISPDVATCEDCLRELLDPANRRYRYPSPTAPTAARVSRSSRLSRMTGRKRPCGSLACAQPVLPSTMTRSIGVSTHSRMPARSAGRDSPFGT